jgi:hypothetical protein
MPGMSFDYAISMGVRRGDSALARELDDILAKRHDDIERILRSYGTPLVDETGRIIAASAAAGEPHTGT